MEVRWDRVWCCFLFHNSALVVVVVAFFFVFVVVVVSRGHVEGVHVVFVGVSLSMKRLLLSFFRWKLLVDEKVCGVFVVSFVFSFCSVYSIERCS